MYELKALEADDCLNIQNRNVTQFLKSHLMQDWLQRHGEMEGQC